MFLRASRRTVSWYCSGHKLNSSAASIILSSNAMPNPLRLQLFHLCLYPPAGPILSTLLTHDSFALESLGEFCGAIIISSSPISSGIINRGGRIKSLTFAIITSQYFFFVGKYFFTHSVTLLKTNQFINKLFRRIGIPLNCSPLLLITAIKTPKNDASRRTAAPSDSNFVFMALPYWGEFAPIRMCLIPGSLIVRGQVGFALQEVRSSVEVSLYTRHAFLLDGVDHKL